MNEVFFDSHDEFFKSPFGAVEINSTVRLKLRIRSDYKVESIRVRVLDESGKSVEKTMERLEEDEYSNVFESEIDCLDHLGLYWYHFVIKTDREEFFYGNNCSMLGGEGEIFRDSPPLSYQITVHKSENTTVDWIKDGIMYQIFPDRFYNGNDDNTVLKPNRDMLLRSNWYDTPRYIKDDSGAIEFFDYFGGNLLGIIKKLPYLKELGVTIIYLNPIFEASSNHKYDTGDYKKIDKMFGDEKLFKSLCDKAREMGIRIILDGVFSHTGSDSIYFNRERNYDSVGAYQSKDSKYFHWYKFKDYPDVYESWWGVDTLPDVEELNEDYLDYIVYDKDSVVNKWSSVGISGWRLDVADELPTEFIKRFKSQLKKADKDSVLIGEVWEDASNKVSYGDRRSYLLGEELDSTMNYPFRNTFLDFFLGVIDSKRVNLEVMKIKENYPLHHFYSLMNLIGTHDIPRILTILGEAPDGREMSQEQKENFSLDKEKIDLAIKRLKMISLIQMSFPGVPSIYYGDEAGLEGYEDPINRRTYPWDTINYEILDWFKKVTSIRTNYDVLKTGTLKMLDLDRDLVGFKREITDSRDVFDRDKKDNTAFVFTNRSSHPVKLDLDSVTDNEQMEKLYNPLDDSFIDISDDSMITISGFESLILLKNK